MAHLLPHEISEALARGVTVLTGNQRAARTLRLHFDRDRLASGLTTWEPPPIFAWDSWTAALHHTLLIEGHTSRLLLNAAQEHTLWRDLIVSDPGWQSLVPPDSLADLAAGAWSRLCGHGGQDRLQSSATSADTRAFVRWARSFTSRCRAENLLPSAQLESTLAASPFTPAADGYLLVGFDRATPAQRSLIGAIRNRGVAVVEFSPTAASDANLLEAPNANEELAAAARWMRHQLELRPDSRLALIVPELATRRAEIDRVLRQTLAPEHTIASPAPPPFEFSLGVPLAHTPLVSAAVDILRWAAAPLPIDRIGQLLLSPHFAQGRALPARAAFDAYELRRHRPLRPELSLDRLLGLVEGSRHVTGLAGTLQHLRRAVEDASLANSRSHSDWADSFRAILSAAGWGAGLDSVGFQTLHRWEATLDELATLDFTGLRVSRAEALDALVRLAQQTLFAPETRDAPLQVMSPIEAAGSTFDAVWFLGAGDTTWPGRGGANPLLSRHLQRDLGMPGASPARDLAEARRVAERIAASAPTVVFSYARELADTRQRPSAAVAGLPLGHTAAAPPPNPPVTLQAVDDAGTLPPLPDRVLQGGANILKHQAACGFRAFAEHRLYATALDSAEPGMDARDRGILVHRILQDFWSGVHTQDNLRAMLPDARRALLTDAIEASLSRAAASNRGAWAAAFLEVQCERLLSVLDAWLVKELDRNVPFLVRAEELQLDDVRIGPLRVNLRVDRVDQTEFGDVILDYKTGDATHMQWLTDRPDEPQLPLYAVVSNTSLAGVAFANIRAGKDMDLHGYQTQPGILLRKAAPPAASLDAQIEAWRETLTALAEDFHGGDLRVRPKAYPTTCQYCKQRLLCRLDITLLEASGEEDQAAGVADD